MKARLWSAGVEQLKASKDGVDSGADMYSLHLKGTRVLCWVV